ncbi:unnamed protein product [Miscanthus lutarioriparius]|uniref:Chromo domain-containing protein n=1 Tax=Miscanthus lutarioriparius TaxID=422564 RepID=A0A811RKU6_9POAL|nr:unnamed protein product [Miscanthus lutarioriparius]
MALGFSNGEIFLGAAGEEEEQASKPATGRSASIQPSRAEPGRRGGARGSAARSSGRRPQRSGLPMDCLSTPRPSLPPLDSEACSLLPETLTLAAADGGGGADAAEAFVAGSEDFFSSLARQPGKEEGEQGKAGGRTDAAEEALEAEARQVPVAKDDASSLDGRGTARHRGSVPQPTLEPFPNHAHFTRRQRRLGVMDPNLQLILDTMNNRFDELDRRFTDRDCASADQDAAVDSRFAALEVTHSAATAAAAAAAAALEQRLAGLESVHVSPLPTSIEQRLTSLEASYIDCDTDYSQHIAELEKLHLATTKDERNARVAALDKATADLASWHPDMEGVVDDVRLQVQKLDSKYDRAVFDSLPQCAGLLQSPAAAATVAKSIAVSELPSGHRVASTPRDVGSGVVTTWTHIPDKGPDEQLCFALSKAASSGSPASHTIHFKGSIAGIPAILLIDSGSSTSFISNAIAAQLSQIKPVLQSSQVQFAGGGARTHLAALPDIRRPSVERVYVKWYHMPASLATWESADHLRKQFPHAPAWGHAATQARGSVSPSANQEAGQPESSSPGERRLEDEAQDKAGSSSLGVRQPTKPNKCFFGPSWINGQAVVVESKEHENICIDHEME